MAIEVDAFHTSKTYAGVYAGLPTPREIIASKKRYMTRFWGPDRLVVVDIDSNFAGERLSKWCSMAWLVDTEGMRHAFLMWFSDEFTEDPHVEAMACVERCGGWPACSEAFEW